MSQQRLGFAGGLAIAGGTLAWYMGRQKRSQPTTASQTKDALSIMQDLDIDGIKAMDIFEENVELPPETKSMKGSGGFPGFVCVEPIEVAFPAKNEFKNSKVYTEVRLRNLDKDKVENKIHGHHTVKSEKKVTEHSTLETEGNSLVAKMVLKDHKHKMVFPHFCGLDLEDAELMFKVFRDGAVHKDYVGHFSLPISELSDLGLVSKELELENHHEKVGGVVLRINAQVFEMPIEKAAQQLVDDVNDSPKEFEVKEFKFDKWLGIKDEVQKNYKLGRTLGSGAYAEVKEGVNSKTGKHFAVKIIRKSELEQEDWEEVMCECEALKNIHHENVIRLYEVYSFPNKLVFILELVSGGTLTQWIENHDPDILPPGVKSWEPEASKITKKCIEGLAYLQQHGIAHRDLKPDNIMLTKESQDRVKLVDFGFAKVTPKGRRQRFKTELGSPMFMAPEVISHSRDGYTTQCDIWSFGVVLYYMLCGYPPFHAKNLNDLHRMVRNTQYDKRSAEFRRLSDDAKDILSKLIAQKDDRATPEELLKHPWITKYN